MPLQTKLNYYFLFFYGIFLLFTSCSLKEKKPLKPKTNDTINFNKIDLYPTLPECEKIEQKFQKTCFYTAISKRIQKNLKFNKLKFDKSIKDSIIVEFLIDNKGKTKLIAIKHSNLLLKKDSLDFYIQKSFQKLPIVKPAIKMGIPVNAKFYIPIVVNSGD